MWTGGGSAVRAPQASQARTSANRARVQSTLTMPTWLLGLWQQLINTNPTQTQVLVLYFSVHGSPPFAALIPGGYKPQSVNGCPWL